MYEIETHENNREGLERVIKAKDKEIDGLK
jgi:hypothetical protein